MLVLLFVVGLFVLGIVLDHGEWKYGRPHRIFIRYEFLAVLIGLVIMIAAFGFGLVDHRRKPGR